MLYFYTNTMEHGTRELVSALGARRLVKFDGMCFRNKGQIIQFGADDAIICWGTHVPPIAGVQIYNSSLNYGNQYYLNANMAKWRGFLATCSAYTPSPYKDYATVYNSFVRDKIRNAGRVPIKEIPGLITLPYNASYKFWKIYVVGGKPVRKVQCTNFQSVHNGLDYYYKGLPINERDHQYTAEICKLTEMDMGSISMAEVKSQLMARKVLTAPWLDTPADVEFFAKEILEYLKSRKEQTNVDAGAGA